MFFANSKKSLCKIPFFIELKMGCRDTLRQELLIFVWKIPWGVRSRNPDFSQLFLRSLREAETGPVKKYHKDNPDQLMRNYEKPWRSRYRCL